MLQKDAFKKYTATAANHEVSFCDQQSEHYPQFLYWSLTLHLEIIIFLFT